MIALFRSLFAPPRHLILLLVALWLGLALAEKRSEQHNISKEALNNIVYYSLFGYVLGGRLFYVLSNLTGIRAKPTQHLLPQPRLVRSAGRTGSRFSCRVRLWLPAKASTLVHT